MMGAGGIPEVRFEDIRPYDGSRHTAFEELCSQLASLEPAEPKSQFFRKGKGADAGVECFLVLADGSQIGWQAKYIFAWSGSLSSQLDKSIRTALRKHPALTQYVVCLPFDLPDQRIDEDRKSALSKWLAWKAKWERFAAKQGRKLDIQLWSKSDLARRLTADAPKYAGRLFYWFDAQYLTAGWFQEQFEKTKVALGSRYSPETNVKVPIRRSFLGFVRDSQLQQELDRWASGIADANQNFTRALKGFCEPAQPPDCGLTIDTCVQAIITSLTLARITPDSEVPIAAWREQLDAAQGHVQFCLRWVYRQPEKSEKKRYGDSPLAWLQHCLFRLTDILKSIREALDSQDWVLVNSQAVLLEGPAGIGKSHLLADVAEHQIHQSCPAIMLLGSAFHDAEPWRQVVTQLDLPPSLQVKNFLGALDAAGQAAGVRALICIDALNERRGADVWPQHLIAFLKTASTFPRVGVVLSCRSTFLRYLIPDEIPANALLRIQHKGFDDGTGEAARTYLDRRGIVRPGAPNLLPEFENPLFLKSVCDLLEADGKKAIPRGMQGITAIFDFYSSAISRSLTRRMALEPRLRIVEKAIDAFAGALANAKSSYIHLDSAFALFEEIFHSGGHHEKNLLSQLEHEGLLTVEPISDDSERGAFMVRFTFERFSDHLIASVLLDTHLDSDVASAFGTDKELGKLLFGRDRHLRAGVIEAVAVQLPERTGLEIVELGSDDWLLVDAFRQSLLWRKQTSFTEKTWNTFLDLCESDEEALSLSITVATEPDNAFNARFLHQRLLEMPMPERDAWWSTYVANFGSMSEGPVGTLISWALHNGLGVIEHDRAELACQTLAWFLACSNREIRDKSTKALSCILAQRLDIAVSLLRQFEGVDDLYVLERLFAAAYGAVLQGVADSGIGALARTTYSIVFAGGTPPLNAPLRDHAYSLIKYVEWLGKLPTTVNMTLVEPPYSSAWPIEYVTEQDLDNYKQDYGRGQLFHDDIVSSTVHDGDFARYVVDSAMSEWSPTPLGFVPQTDGELLLEWLTEFTAQASQQQLQAFDELCEASLAASSQPRYSKTPERDALEAAESRFKLLVSERLWIGYETKAQWRLPASLDESINWGLNHRATFKGGWARRWVCKRAHDLGWTPELFADFDRARSSSRMEHRVERIGKKYQWLAFFELQARMADNLNFIGSYGRDEFGIASPRQASRIDIDPSLLVAETNYDGWAEWGRTWWVPRSPIRFQLEPEERLAWLDSQEDIVNGADLICVQHPKTGRRWICLSGFAIWRQKGGSAAQKELQREAWFRLDCIVVRKQNEARLVAGLKNKIITDSHFLPHNEVFRDFYIGECLWHPDSIARSGWISDEGYRLPAVEIRRPTLRYTCESGGYDYSIDRTISVELPAPWFAEALDIRLSNGRRMTFVDRGGEVRFFDPSVSDLGPQAALVDEERFFAMLEREGLAAVWVVAGEKSAHAGRDFNMKFGGEVSHTAVYWVADGEFRRVLHVVKQEPSSTQLKAFLGKKE